MPKILENFLLRLGDVKGKLKITTTVYEIHEIEDMITWQWTYPSRKKSVEATGTPSQFIHLNFNIFEAGWSNDKIVVANKGYVRVYSIMNSEAHHTRVLPRG